ncbi:MAG TPA: hypothetical protein VJQ47_04850 [Steroidobacteraceae bacterium]|nr:hypothetical protein [Steroidobacteraceae bacterium]
MSIRITIVKSLLLSSMAVAACASSAFAGTAAPGAATTSDSAKSERTEPTKEMREKMAAVHEEMATCLRSDKPIAECRKQMMKAHEELHSESGCPGMKMHEHGAHKDAAEK